MGVELSLTAGCDTPCVLHNQRYLISVFLVTLILISKTTECFYNNNNKIVCPCGLCSARSCSLPLFTSSQPNTRLPLRSTWTTSTSDSSPITSSPAVMFQYVFTLIFVCLSVCLLVFTLIHCVTVSEMSSVSFSRPQQMKMVFCTSLNLFPPSLTSFSFFFSPFFTTFYFLYFLLFWWF